MVSNFLNFNSNNISLGIALILSLIIIYLTTDLPSISHSNLNVKYSGTSLLESPTGLVKSDLNKEVTLLLGVELT